MQSRTSVPKSASPGAGGQPKTSISRAGDAGVPLLDRRFSDLHIQPKLQVGSVDDPLEHQADAAAERVMRMPDGKCSGCQKDEEESHEKLARKETAGAARHDGVAAPPIVRDVLREPGQPLGASARAFFEPRFGFDFSKVRIHTDARAAQSASRIDAAAFTVGHNVVFGAGRYAPGSESSSRLLAHELAHVVQQTASPLGVQRQPAAAPALTAAQITAAIQFNNNLFHDPYSLAVIRDLLGIARFPAVVDEDFIHALVAWQHTHSLTQNGKADPDTLRALILQIIAAKQFDDAIGVIIDGFHFPTANLQSIKFDTATTAADAVTSGDIGTGKPQTILVGPSTFTADYPHMIRIIGHELQHVQQRTGATPIANQHVREFLSFAWEALATDSPALAAADRVNHANIAISHWNLAPVADRPPFQATRDRLDRLIAAAGVGKF